MESTLIYILGVQLGSGVEIQFRLDARLGKSGKSDLSWATQLDPPALHP